MLGGGIFLMVGSQKYINQYSEELVRSSKCTRQLKEDLVFNFQKFQKLLLY